MSFGRTSPNPASVVRFGEGTGSSPDTRLDESYRRPHGQRPPAGSYIATIVGTLHHWDLNETHCIDYAGAYLVASAERARVTDIASFDQSIDRVPTVTRIEP